MAGAIKFVHASDFHLDRPISGLSEIPSHLKSTLANAPYTAAERVFSLAESQRVDFVLLSGDLLDLNGCGPRAAAFLLRQFERMANRGIAVYWCGGSVDQPDRWPSGIELPPNVTIFSSTVVEHVVHHNGKQALATICGSGFDNRRRKPSDFRCDSDAAYPIALLHGQIDTTSVSAQNIKYWALGGSHKRRVMEPSGTLVASAGTTQSRSPLEPGSYGCFLVIVDAQRNTRVHPYDFDSVRWNRQKITIAESASMEDIKSVLSERVQKIRNDSPEQAVLTNWKISATGEFNPELRSEKRRHELIAWLRNEFGQSGNGIWTVGFSIEPPRTLPAGWYEEETILGDYLRATGRYQNDETMVLPVSEWLTSQQNEGPLADICRIEAADRERILQEASLLGVEYLGRHENSGYPLDS